MLAGWFCIAACIVPHGYAKIGPAYSEHRNDAAPVILDGRRIGAYVDDTYPGDKQQLVNELRPYGTVYVGSAGHDQDYGPGTVTLVEYYPVGIGWPPFPLARSYVLQGAFRWPGKPHPTYRQQRRMWCEARRARAGAVFWYYYSRPNARRLLRIMREPCAWAA